MKHTPILLPALRGSMGDWIYYSCLMPLSEIGRRVEYADEIHPDKALSSLIQRSLEGTRAKHIAEYLSSTTERFFNALVLATYGGKPDWVEVGNFRAAPTLDVLKHLTPSTSDTLGFLKLSGKERIFAIDGQHRLAGIKQAIAQGLDLSSEQGPVILVGHKKDASGLQRTRRLFTTLNKTAVPVRKRDIIALDEDDVMAIVSRRLVESNPSFRSPKIAVVSSQNIPAGNQVCLTTIASLYDILKIIFMFEVKQRSDRTLRFNRPSDAQLDRYEIVATQFFAALGFAFRDVGALFSADDPATVTAACRGDHGGHLLFRPIGLEIFTRVAVELAERRQIALSDSVAILAAIPTEISESPYRHVIWNPTRRSVVSGGKVLARKLVKYMVGLGADGDLLHEYRIALQSAGADATELPAQIHASARRQVHRRVHPK